MNDKVVDITKYFRTCENCIHYLRPGCDVPGGWHHKIIRRPGCDDKLICADFRRGQKL